MLISLHASTIHGIMIRTDRLQGRVRIKPVGMRACGNPSPLEWNGVVSVSHSVIVGCFCCDANVCEQIGQSCMDVDIKRVWGKYKKNRCIFNVIIIIIIIIIIVIIVIRKQFIVNSASRAKRSWHSDVFTLLRNTIPIKPFTRLISVNFSLTFNHLLRFWSLAASVQDVLSHKAADWGKNSATMILNRWTRLSPLLQKSLLNPQ